MIHSLLRTMPKGWRTTLKRRVYGGRGNFPYYGHTVFFPKDSLVFRMACMNDTYEKPMLSLLHDLAEPGTTIFDVGTNIGLMSVALLQVCPECRVVSFEPSPNSLKYLQKTYAASSQKARWTLVPKACGTEPGRATFHLAAEADAAYEGLRDTGRGSGAGTVEVEISTLDAEWRALGCPQVSVIKIDVEGAETMVLGGAAELIRACQPAILLEWNPANLVAYDVEADSLLVRAEAMGYQVFDGSNRAPVVSPRHLHLHLRRQEMFILLPGAGTSGAPATQA